MDDRPELERRLYFRDRLRADLSLAAEYVVLKRALAARYPEDREAYTEAKAPFIKRVERQTTSEDTPARSIANSASELVFHAATVSNAQQLGRAIAEGFQGYLSFAPADWIPRSAEDESELLRALFDSDDFWCLLAWAGSAPTEWVDAERVQAERAVAGRVPAERVLAGHIAFLPANRAWRNVEDPNLAHLRQLFLAPDFWGAGLARTLHNRALRVARERGFTAMRLFTPTGQARARGFYEREGWTVDGEPFCDPGFGLQLVEYRRSLR